jgi:hypothetical protein
VADSCQCDCVNVCLYLDRGVAKTGPPRVYSFKSHCQVAGSIKCGKSGVVLRHLYTTTKKIRQSLVIPQATTLWVKQQMLYKDRSRHRIVRMCITKKRGWHFLCFVLLSCSILPSNGQNAPGAQFAGVQIQMRIGVCNAAEQLSEVHKNAIADFFATQTQSSCSPLSCPLTPATDVVF